MFAASGSDGEGVACSLARPERPGPSVMVSEAVVPEALGDAFGVGVSLDSEAVKKEVERTVSSG